MQFQKQVSHRLISLFVRAISVYQVTLSPDHGLLRVLSKGRVCRFEPTCSEYTKQSLQAHGMYGLILGVKQFIRCHPFS